MIPRQIYAFAKQETLQNLELLADEDGSAICTDCKDYYGKVVYDGGLGFKLGFQQKDFEIFDAAFVRVIMDNDGVSEEFVDIEAVKDELRKRSELRIGGPWVLKEDLATPDSRIKPAAAARPRVGLPYIPDQSQNKVQTKPIQ